MHLFFLSMDIFLNYLYNMKIFYAFGRCDVNSKVSATQNISIYFIRIGIQNNYSKHVIDILEKAYNYIDLMSFNE